MSDPRVFQGERHPDDPRRVTLDGQPLPIAPSLRLINHSPTGFEWGYGGSGPAQLALAILLEVAGESCAIRNYQQFKREVIAQLATERWEIPESDVSAWLADAAAARGKA